MHQLLQGRRSLLSLLRPFLRGLRRARMAPNRRSGLSLHRSGMMVMIHRLRGRKPVLRVLSWSFSSWHRIRPENALLFGLFHALPRSCRGMPLGEPVRVRRVLCGVGVEAVLESCFHSCRKRPSRGAGVSPRRFESFLLRLCIPLAKAGPLPLFTGLPRGRVPGNRR